VYEVRFEKPKDLSFIAGQYLLFQVPLLEHPSDIQPRAYSIASAPEEDDLLFVIKLIPGGRFSRFLTDELKPGVTMQMQGPIGRFVLHDDSAPLLFVATSTGIAPFRSMIVSMMHKKDPRTVDLLFGVRSEADQFWMEELEKLSVLHPTFSYELTLSQPSSGWTGLKGRVQEVLPSIISDVSSSRLYACGNPGMTLELKKMAIEKWGMKKENVHVEGYV
jgi:NAD(P)H-flavin reductase